MPFLTHLCLSPLNFFCLTRSTSSTYCPLPTLILSFKLTQLCHASQTRLISEPKICKVQCMTILKISTYPFPPLSSISTFLSSSSFILLSPHFPKKIFTAEVLKELWGQSQMNYSNESSYRGILTSLPLTQELLLSHSLYRNTRTMGSLPYKGH